MPELPNTAQSYVFFIKREDDVNYFRWTGVEDACNPQT